jgi:putative spermidine/putrescine transport system permease protein
VAAVSTVVSGIIGTMAAIYYVLHSGRAKETVRIAMLAPLLLPEVLTAIALLFFVYAIGLGTQNMVGMIVGHVLITLPFVFINVSASLESFDPSWDMAARSLGADRFTRFRRIMLPMIKSGVIGGCLFAFIISFDVFTISFLLKGIGTSTLPIQLFDYLRTNFTPEAAAVSTVSIVLTLAVVIVARVSSRAAAMGGCLRPDDGPSSSSNSAARRPRAVLAALLQRLCHHLAHAFEMLAHQHRGALAVAQADGVHDAGMGVGRAAPLAQPEGQHVGHRDEALDHRVHH